ncbi:MAG: ATP-binding protein [Pseudomonadota bacterium]
MEKLADCHQSQEILQVLRDFAAHPRGFLLMAGSNGTGKTYASKAVGRECRISQPYSSEFPGKIFVKQANLNTRLNEYRSMWGNVRYLEKYYAHPELLIIDDLGTRTPSEAFMDFLYVLVDDRYDNRHRKGTIITTNLTASQMRERFGDAFTSRAASGKLLRMDGDDRRFEEF